jgi:hypothetical protein
MKISCELLIGPFFSFLFADDAVEWVPRAERQI